MILLSKLTVHSVIYLSVCRYLFFQQSGRRGEEEPNPKNNNEETPHNYDDIISPRRLNGYVTTLEPSLVTSLPR